MRIMTRFFAPVERFLARRRFRTLFIILAILFVADVFIPDPIPLIDELILLVATVIVGSFRKPRESNSTSTADS
ncbi:MAG TPA: DUF6116 family protein [Wenzhouxiangella sp.]|nr:DUF6116 family protein [Wenzhouxiangella sp.]